ncbi:MAG TPA: hypothetical protein VMM76_10300, partial [Pirellulaceae bacterium]|nr:hypothetical protein [Pirellulaceae bacterium]
VQRLACRHAHAGTVFQYNNMSLVPRREHIKRDSSKLERACAAAEGLDGRWPLKPPLRSRNLESRSAAKYDRIRLAPASPAILVLRPPVDLRLEDRWRLQCGFPEATIAAHR